MRSYACRLVNDALFYKQNMKHFDYIHYIPCTNTTVFNNTTSVYTKLQVSKYCAKPAIIP